METERLNIFNENQQHIGTATRQDAHHYGYWHETFHCWFIGKENDRWQLYFQIRSAIKTDYPSLLDITVAGHLLAHETVQDGLREMEEEVGIVTSFDSLIPIGKVSYTLLNPPKIDNEIANVFLYPFNGTMEDFNLQVEEVSGIIKVDLEQFHHFWNDELDTIEVNGFEVIDGERYPVCKAVTKDDFVHHGEHYFDVVLTQIERAIN